MLSRLVTRPLQKTAARHATLQKPKTANKSRCVTNVLSTNPLNAEETRVLNIIESKMHYAARVTRRVQIGVNGIAIPVVAALGLMTAAAGGFDPLLNLVAPATDLLGLTRHDGRLISVFMSTTAVAFANHRIIHATDVNWDTYKTFMQMSDQQKRQLVSWCESEANITVLPLGGGTQPDVEVVLHRDNIVVDERMKRKIEQIVGQKPHAL